MKKIALAVFVSTFIIVAAVGLAGCKSTQSASMVAAKPYPLKTCIVTDETLGEHGKPYVFVYEGQEVKLCCEDCRKDFEKEPAKYLSKLAPAK